ncbi:MAG: exosortase [Pyrinomonadaceae bacterium]
MKSESRAQLWQPLLMVAAVGFVYATMLARLAGQWWTDENYSHGLLMPFIVGYILWAERARFAAAPKRPALLAGAACVVLALLTLWAGTAGAELYLQRTSLVLMIAGICVYFWGWRVLRLVVVPLVLLLLAIPIPAIIFNRIAFPLQLFASRAAVASMQMLDIPVLRQGNVIELMTLGSSTPKRLEVVEACSGIRSLMTLVTLAVVFAYFSHPRDEARQGSGRFAWLKSYGTWRSAVLVASAVPIAIITNAGRVSGTGILSRYYGTKVADGFFHEFSGWVVYVVAFLLLFALGWLLDKLANRKQRRAHRLAASELTVAPRAAEAARVEQADEARTDSTSVGAPVAAATARGVGDAS